MQMAFYLAGEITQVKESIPGVRCASGNVFFIAAIGDQFRELLGLLHIHKLPKVRHHNKHYHQWGKVKQIWI